MNYGKIYTLDVVWIIIKNNKRKGERNMGKRHMSEMEHNNKFAMIAHALDALVMCGFCIVQTIQENRAVWYIFVALILGFAPVLGEVHFWRKDKNTEMIKHFVGYGFAIFYTFFLFTSTNNLFFAFVVPMILAISVYSDIAYSIKINVGVVAESILVVIIGASVGGLGYEDVYSATIQIVLAILVAVYSVVTSAVLKHNNTQKLDEIKSAQESITLVSKETKRGIRDMNELLDKLNASSVMVKDNMEQVTEGIVDTTDAVQDQLVQTEAIQFKVNDANDVAANITESMEQTLSVLESGKNDVEILVGQVEESVKNGTEVAGKLSNLDTYISEMNSIVELISGITSQTGLLALNASIEAARAGEAGKGFAVVATEISHMATQTKNATEHITALIGNVSTAINDVVNVVYQMIEGINQEKDSTVHAVQSFDNIQKNTELVQESIIKLAHNLKELKVANKTIVESVQRISGVSEEVTARATETMHAEEENVDILDKISNRMHEVLEITKKV